MSYGKQPFLNPIRQYILHIMVRIGLITGLIQAIFAQDSDVFINATLRVDYFHLADADSELFTLDKYYRQGEWSGNPHHYIDPLPTGKYLLEIYDQSSGKLVFSRSFTSYCAEYRTTDPAVNGIKRTYHESALIPYPKSPVLLVLKGRDKMNLLKPVWQILIDPDQISIEAMNQVCLKQVQQVVSHGPCQEKVDLVFIAEGYTIEESGKFEQDLQRYISILFNWQPYQSHTDNFNIYSVFCPSDESGSDEPHKGIFKNTLLNSTFNSLGSARYLLTDDNKVLQNLAAAVPYDAIIILVNSPVYGGGGIYNWYSILTSDHPSGEYLFHHEFGHSFAGLADEYYTSNVAYLDFYPAGVEPVDPNLTALLDPKNVKWAAFLSPGIDIPTAWQQQVHDSLQMLRSRNWQEMNTTLTEMRRQNITADTLAGIRDNYLRYDDEIRNQLNDFFIKHPQRGKIGAFEGAGYKSKGLYRPTLNSIMNRFAPEDKSFYVVSEQHIIRIINHYTGMSD
jgi:hypothetical protein